MHLEPSVKIVNKMDMQIALSVGICLLLAYVVPNFQTMTACIATLLCVQDSVMISRKTGVTRLIITFIGGLVGIAVVLLDQWIGISWVFWIAAVAGVILTMSGCKMAKVPVFSARIGAITYVLVILTRVGSARIEYAFYRLLSTLYGVIVVLIVTAVFSFFGKKRAVEAVRDM